MVRSDHEGGDTLIAAVEDVVRELNEDVLSTLAEPIFPFGCGAHPVISKRAGTPHIRYYRRQINKALGKGELPTVAALAAMEVLDAVLRRYTILHQFKLETGETLFIHNTKALHGRTGFAAQSDRLLYRVRMHAGCLG
jgi:hypothetical protein